MMDEFAADVFQHKALRPGLSSKDVPQAGERAKSFLSAAAKMARGVYEWEPLCVWHFVWITDLSLGTVAYFCRQ